MGQNLPCSSWKKLWTPAHVSSDYVGDSCCWFLKEDIDRKHCQTKIYLLRQVDTFITHHSIHSSGLQLDSELAWVTKCYKIREWPLCSPGQTWTEPEWQVQLKWTVCFISVKGYLSLMLKALKVTPLYRWGHCILEKLSDMPMSPQTISGRAKIETKYSPVCRSHISLPKLSSLCWRVKILQRERRFTDSQESRIGRLTIMPAVSTPMEVSFRNKLTK